MSLLCMRHVLLSPLFTPKFLINEDLAPARCPLGGGPIIISSAVETCN